MELKPDETIDLFMEGRLKLIQSRGGYRFSVDALLVAEFVSTGPGDLVVDLGTGCGVIPLILLLTRPIRRAVGLEIQEDLADQARRNASINGFADRMDVVLGDIRCLPIKPPVDVVICNPPYRPRTGGRINPDPRRAIARHEIHAATGDIFTAAARILRRGGRFATIYPASRLVEIVTVMRGAALEPKRIRPVYPRSGSEARLILVEAVSGGKAGVKILPPLIDTGHPAGSSSS